MADIKGQRVKPVGTTSEEYSNRLSEIIQIYNERRPAKSANYINAIKCTTQGTNTLIEISLSRNPDEQNYLLSNYGIVNDVSRNDKTLTKALRHWLALALAQPATSQKNPIILDAGVFYRRAQGTAISPILIRQLA